jgi:hypothetical protein
VLALEVGGELCTVNDPHYGTRDIHLSRVLYAVCLKKNVF